MENRKIISNAKWIIVCKIAQSLLQLLVGMLTARYLGPENYGLINYAKSIVAFAVPFVQLGLNATLVHELIESPEKEGEIVGTSVVMSVISSFGCMILVAAFVSVANRGETQTLIVCFLYSLSLLFLATELVQYWFHCKLKSKYPSIMMLCSYVVVSAYKIYLLVSRKSIYWFAVVHSIEYGIIGISLLIIYRKLGSQKISCSLACAKKLLTKSRYYILSAMMVTTFQNTDHIMLKIMTGDAENGFYSAAITCVSVCQFLYTAIIDSMRPMILSQKKAASPEYAGSISRLYCIIIYLSLLQGIAFCILAKPIVYILYGKEYLQAGPVLRILVWYLAFSFMGTIRNIWLLAENMYKLLWKINLTGTLANIVLNAIFIPYWGACGAAMASLLTQAFANLIIGFLYKPLRENNRLLIRGLDIRLLATMFKNTLFS